MKKSLLISLKLIFTPNTSACYGVSCGTKTGVERILVIFQDRPPDDAERLGESFLLMWPNIGLY